MILSHQVVLAYIEVLFFALLHKTWCASLVWSSLVLLLLCFMLSLVLSCCTCWSHQCQVVFSVPIILGCNDHPFGLVWIFLLDTNKKNRHLCLFIALLTFETPEMKAKVLIKNVGLGPIWFSFFNGTEELKGKCELTPSPIIIFLTPSFVFYRGKIFEQEHFFVKI